MNYTREQILTWPVENGWRVHPETYGQTRIHERATVGRYATVGRDASPQYASVIPVVENLATCTLEAIAAGGTLEMSSYHSCNTTHCRAGWAIHLAGERGYALETLVGAWTAGQAIIKRSCKYRKGRKAAPNFFDTNENALADIRDDAAMEAAG